MNTERTTINRANKLLARFIAIANGVALAEGCTLDTTTSKGLTTLRLSQAAPDGSVRVLLHVEATVARLPEKAPRAKPEQKVLDFNAPAAPSAPTPRNSIDDTTPPELPADVAPTLPLWLRDLVLVAPPGAWCIVEDRGREPFDHREFENETDARAHLRDTQLEALDVRRAVLVSPDREPLAWWRFNADNTFERWPELPMQPAAEPFADVLRFGEERELSEHCEIENDAQHVGEATEAAAHSPADEKPANEKPADAPKKPRNVLVSVEVHDRHQDGEFWSREKGLQFILGGFLFWGAEGGASRPDRVRQVAIVPQDKEEELLEELREVRLGAATCETDNGDTLLRVGSLVSVDDGAPWTVASLNRMTCEVVFAERPSPTEHERTTPYDIEPTHDGSGRFRLIKKPTPKAEPKTATPKSSKSKPSKKGPRA